MNYRFEYCGNPDYVSVHVTVRLTDHDFVSKSILICHPCDSEYDEDRQLLSLLQTTEGVAGEITLRPDSISVSRGAAFDRDSVCNAVFELLKIWLVMKYGQLEFCKLPTLRSDVLVKRCTVCKEEQDREMAHSPHDVLEY